MEIFGIPSQALFGQLLIGLINGSFYALLSLGLAVIFGLLNIINFSHGAQYMLGAFVAYLSLNKLGINYWVSLILTPLLVGATGVLIEKTMLKRLYKLDHLYGLLLTFGLALIIQGVFRHEFGSSGMPYPSPEVFQGVFNLGFMFLPKYRAWVIVVSLIVCLGTWFVIDHQTWCLFASSHREPQFGSSVRHQCAPHGHIDLRFWCGACSLGRGHGCTHLSSQPLDGR